MFVTKIIKKSKYFFVGLLFLICQSNLSAQNPKLYRDTLDFGNIEIGSTPKYLLDTLQNDSSYVVDIVNLFFEGPSANLFSVIGNDKIPRNGNMQFAIGFPTRISGLGRKEAKLIFRFRPRVSFDTLYLKGNIVPVYRPEIFSYAFSIPKMSHKTGDTFKLPIIIDKFDETDSLNFATFQIRFNQSMMAFVNESDIGTIKDGYHSITRNVRLRENGKLIPKKVGDTLFSIDVIATLGDSISTQIDFLSANVDGIGAKYRYRTTTTNGSLSLTDVLFKDNNPRLVASSGELSGQIQLVNGNVLSTSLPINIGYQGSGTLKLYNAVTGQMEGELPLTKNSTYVYKSLVLTKDLFLSNGTYLLLLENEFGNASSIIMVE